MDGPPPGGEGARELAVGVAPELLAGDLDDPGALDAHVVALGMVPGAQPGRVREPLEPSDGERHHHRRRAVARIGSRRELGPAADEWGVADGDLKQPVPPVCEHDVVGGHS